MKKLLAMVLALVMTLSLAVSANAAFKDADKVSDTYEEAVAVLNGMGVFKGYEDGSFQPQGDITRAEVAAIVYRVYTQDVKDAKASLYATYNKFSDMTGAGWAAGYIGYCANAELVKGYPNGTFQPSGKVTGYEVLAMILRAIGYDKNGEFSGADWALHVAQTAQQAKILDNVKGVDLNAPATRELVAELLFRAIADAPMVTYTAAFGYQTVSFSGKKDGKIFEENETLGHKNFDLTDKPVNGDYGRPATEWKYNVGDEKTTVYDKPVATYTEKVAPCDVCKDLSEKKEATFVEQWVDGVQVVDSAKKAVSETYKSTDTTKKIGAQGLLTEVYENGDDYTVVYINTYLAKVTKVIDEVKDKNDHVKVEASVNVNVYGWTKDKASFETTGFAKNDMVLVTVDDGEIASMEAAKGEVAKLTSVKGAKHVGDTTDKMSDILGVAYADATVACKATVNPLEGTTVALGDTYTFYYDSYGNIIGVDKYDRDANYVVIDRVWLAHDNGKVTYHADLVSAADASVISDVVLDSVEGKELTDITANEKATANKGYYHDMMLYSIDKDGEYELYKAGTKVVYKTGDKQGDDVLCYYNTNTKSDVIYTADGLGNVYLDKDTVILFQYENSPSGTFKSNTLDNLPEKFYGYVEYVVGSDGKADVVYIRGAEMDTSYVFITDVSDVDTEINEEDDTVTLTLNSAYTYDESTKTLVQKPLTVTGTKGNIVIDNIDNADLSESQVDLTKLTQLKKAGLYELLTVGGNNSYLVYTGVYKVEAIKEYSDKDVVLGITDGGEQYTFGSAFESYWTGHYAKDGKLPSAAKFEDAKDANSEIKANDYVFVQFNDDDEIIAVYKVDFEVAVNGEYNGTEYWGTKFANIEVELKPYEKIDTAKMGQKDLTVSYVGVDGKTYSADEVEGVAVAKAILSQKYVEADITYTVVNQDAYTDTTLDLNNGEAYKFSNNDQTATIAETNKDADAKINGTITVDKKTGDVTAGDLADLLKANAKNNEHQTIVGVYNTQDVESSKVAGNVSVADDMFVKVQAWDGKTVAYYLVKIADNG